ncbi:hypothetical protein PSEUBRA_005435 [Kalmanozyma brasiliensis GHG001]|uniref:uncharacterized protein n=1 Tax=Kalmanozyma brasiliensis (strain GHG001) TaxID=1365824 RepID=UPI0028680500|nr:uncharacterized protein PSEUBRA_005435 [Kalmanozyma brasiliensis GHG001]KAF6767522.1 hypothetical protein PSEUBRA_005435 [Kalmanozyma brasiliensis GHG001]
MSATTVASSSRTVASHLVMATALSHVTASTTVSASRSMTTASSAKASSSSASSSSRPRRSARFAARPGADMVGPPDPISNLRPIRYGSAFEEVTSPSVSSPSATASLSHPYSLQEFTSSSSTLPGTSRAPSLYFERLLAKLESAELAHKLRMARADSFNQRFWQENNARFIQALGEFRSRTGSSKAVATTGKGNTTNEQENELDLDSDSLATFYSAWLKANSARHRAYNRQLWRQTFGDLAPAARYQGLRAWAKVVGSVERRLGRIN